MKRGKLFSGFAFLLLSETVQGDKLLRLVSLREIKLDSNSLKLSILPLDVNQSKKLEIKMDHDQIVHQEKHYNLNDINAPIELPSDQDEDYDDSSDSMTMKKKVKLKKVLVNIDTKQVEKTFTHEVILQFLLKKKMPILEEKLIFFTESREWSIFWRNTIQGLHDSNRKFTYNNNIPRDVKHLDKQSQEAATA